MLTASIKNFIELIENSEVRIILEELIASAVDNNFL
jgi:hypothetical protein